MGSSNSGNFHSFPLSLLFSNVRRVKTSIPFLFPFPFFSYYYSFYYYNKNKIHIIRCYGSFETKDLGWTPNSTELIDAIEKVLYKKANSEATSNETITFMYKENIICGMIVFDIKEDLSCAFKEFYGVANFFQIHFFILHIIDLYLRF